MYSCASVCSEGVPQGLAFAVCFLKVNEVYRALHSSSLNVFFKVSRYFYYLIGTYFYFSEQYKTKIEFNSF